jgi:hypothetical protein
VAIQVGFEAWMALFLVYIQQSITFDRNTKESSSDCLAQGEGIFKSRKKNLEVKRMGGEKLTP